jgi:hypothetical protein
MPPKNINPRLMDAEYDLKFLLNRRYNKKNSLNFVSNKYLLNKEAKNYLVRKVFSNEKIMARMIKIVDIHEINNKTVFIDGYNVLITVEMICNQEYEAILMCDDGVLRDIKAVFGKYKSNPKTEDALNRIIRVLKNHNPLSINFFYDSPVSNSGELAKLTESLIKSNNISGNALTKKNVDYDLVKQSKKVRGIVGTSDGVIIDKVENVLDIPYWICDSLKQK